MDTERRGRRRGPYARSSQRRQEIVDAAFEVFAAKGYNAGSLQAVADRAGLSQTSLLHYFPTKRDLLLAVLEQRDSIDRSGQGGKQAFPDDLTEQVRVNEQNPGLLELYTVLCGEAVTRDHPGRAYFVRRFTELRGEYANELSALAARGRLRAGVDPVRAATSIIALWDGLQMQWLMDRSVDMLGCLRDYLDTIILPDDAEEPLAREAAEQRV